MKILMTSETYSPRIGGAEVHVFNLFSRLRQSGHAVTLVTNEKGDTEKENEQGVIRHLWENGSLKTIYKNFLCIWTNSKGVSVIHSHYSHRLAMLAGLAGRLRRVPVVVTLHGMGILDLPSSSRKAKIKHAVYRYLALKLCTHVISTSEDLATVALRYISRKKITVIMNGYDAQKFQVKDDSGSEIAGIPAEKKIIMSVRRLVPKNGPHYMIEALPLVLKECPNVHYVVVGDGVLRAKMERRVQELKIEKYVTFIGRVNNELIPQFLSRADVIVFPSTAESSSIACAEAMGMGKLIVASRVGGLVELLGATQERGYLIDLVPWTNSNYAAPEALPKDSYQNLANGLLTALQNSPENEKIRKTAQKFAQEELSWDAILKKTLSIYNNLITK